MTSDIALRVNGAELVLPAGACVADVLRAYTPAAGSPDIDIANARIAVECNGAIVPRSLWAQTRLASGDMLEILQFVGGG